MNTFCGGCQIFSTCIVSTLSASSLEKLEQNKTMVVKKRNETLFTENTDAKNILILLEGNVKLELHQITEHDIIVKIANKSEILNIESLYDLNIGKNYLTAVCKTAVRCCQFPKDAFREAIENSTEAKLYISNFFLNNYKNYIKQSIQFIHSKTQSKIAFALINTAESDGSINITHEELARLTGLKRETVSRNLSYFIETKAISKKGKKLKILNKNAVLKYLEN